MQNWNALLVADDSLKADKEVVMTAVTKNGFALECANASLKSDKEVVMAAVTQFGYSLKYANDSLKADKEVVMAAVTEYGCALHYANDSFKSDKEVVMAAVTQKGHLLERADALLKMDREVVTAALKQGFALRDADESLRTDLELQLVDARNRSATFALKLVRQLSNLPQWEEKDAELNRAVELLAAFPDSQPAPKVNKKLHDLVERMVKRAYKPGRKRDLAAFETDFIE
jgi:hypothetical protein